MSQESHQFQSDVPRLLNHIVHSVYSDKDIFLRELISNSSDALEKLRLLSLTNHELLQNEPDMFIRIIPNSDNKTLTLWDSGIGMDKSDMINYLGTLAKSHTSEFKQSDSNMNVNDIIGQFGLGFYASFLVAHTVDVYSRKYNDSHVYKWSSTASNNFTIEEVIDDTLVRGTKIVLHMNDSTLEFLTEQKLKEIIGKHSSFTKYPIALYVSKTQTSESTDEKTETKVNEFEQQNTQVPIWRRDTKDLTADDYKKFYHHLNNDKEDYLSHVHFKIEGNNEFTCLIFVPKRAPFDLFKEKKDDVDISLYVKRVFVSKQCKEIVPDYLNFLKGIVDFEDLPLNISRELLQNKTKYIKTVNEQITKRIVDSLMNLDDDSYKTFYDQYSKNIKLGVYTDKKNCDKLKTLLRYYTVNHQDSQISLATYVSEMKEGQTDIYYITGSQKNDLLNSPFVECLKSRGYDIILMLEPLDEYVTQSLTDFDSKKLTNITNHNLKLNDTTTDESQYKEFINYVKTTLASKVSKVTLSKLLGSGNAPCVVSSDGITANYERILKSQPLQNDHMMQFMKSVRTFELNMSHPLVQHLASQVANKTNDKYTDNSIHILFDTALMSSGYQMDNSQNFSKRIYNMMEMTMLKSDLVDVVEQTQSDPMTQFDDNVDYTQEVDDNSCDSCDDDDNDIDD